MEQHPDEDKYSSNNEHQRGKTEQKPGKDNGCSSSSNQKVNEEKTKDKKDEDESRSNSESELTEEQTDRSSRMPVSKRRISARIAEKKRALNRRRGNRSRRDDPWHQGEELMPSVSTRKRRVRRVSGSNVQPTDSEMLVTPRFDNKRRRTMGRSTKSNNDNRDEKKSKKGKCETPGECNCGSNCRCRMCSCGRGMKKNRKGKNDY